MQLSRRWSALDLLLDGRNRGQEQWDAHGLVWAPFLAHSIPASLPETVEPNRGTGVGGKTQIMPLLISERHDGSGGLRGCPHLVPIRGVQLPDGVVLEVVPGVSTCSSRHEKHVNGQLVPAVVIIREWTVMNAGSSQSHEFRQLELVCQFSPVAVNRVNCSTPKGVQIHSAYASQKKYVLRVPGTGVRLP